MRFVRDDGSGIHVIRGYGAGEIRISDQVLHDAVIVSATRLIVEPDLRTIADLAADLAPAIHQRLAGLAPDLVLVGSGARQVFPPAAFGARFLTAGIGFEVMDTGAACRTFNVLVSEGRNVAALLIL